MPVITFKYRKILKLFTLVILILAVISSVRWAGKVLYPINYSEHINRYSDKYDIDPLLVASIIRVESRYDKEAESNKGARGLMQITPSTGQWIAEKIGIENYNVDMLYDPETNIMFGCWYLDNLRTEFQNIQLVIAAYNGGRGNVAKWLMDKNYSNDGKTLEHIPFKETEEYVVRVERAYKIYNKLYDHEDFEANN